MCPTLDITTFRLMFPIFASTTLYPDDLLNMFYEVATDFIPPYPAWGGLKPATLKLALQYLTAHLLYEYKLQARNQTGKVVTGATVDKVTVSLLAPPVKDGWDFWLNQSPYGQSLLALLKLKSAGGWSVGGSPERAGFRVVGGVFRR